MTAPCCAHLRVSWRTEQVAYDGPEIPGTDVYVPLKPGTMVTRGWWECDDNCGARFAPIPRAAVPALPDESERHVSPHRFTTPRGSEPL